MRITLWTLVAACAACSGRAPVESAAAPVTAAEPRATPTVYTMDVGYTGSAIDY